MVFSATLAVVALVKTGAAKMFTFNAVLGALSLPAASVNVKVKACAAVLKATLGVSVPVVLLYVAAVNTPST